MKIIGLVLEIVETESVFLTGSLECAGKLLHVSTCVKNKS